MRAFCKLSSCGFPTGFGTVLKNQWLPQLHRASPSATLDERIYEIFYLYHNMTFGASARGGAKKISF